MPFFDSFFVYPLKANDLGFETDSRIGTIDIPILILHAVDDPVVPFALGQKVCIRFNEEKRFLVSKCFFIAFRYRYEDQIEFLSENNLLSRIWGRVCPQIYMQISSFA